MQSLVCSCNQRCCEATPACLFARPVVKHMSSVATRSCCRRAASPTLGGFHCAVRTGPITAHARQEQQRSWDSCKLGGLLARLSSRLRLPIRPRPPSTSKQSSHLWRGCLASPPPGLDVNAHCRLLHRRRLDPTQFYFIPNPPAYRAIDHSPPRAGRVLGCATLA